MSTVEIPPHLEQNIFALNCPCWIYIQVQVHCCNVKTRWGQCLEIHTLEEAVFFRLEPTLSPLASSSMESPSSPSLLASAALPPSPSVSEELCCWMACAWRAEKKHTSRHRRRALPYLSTPALCWREAIFCQTMAASGTRPCAGTEKWNMSALALRQSAQLIEPHCTAENLPDSLTHWGDGRSDFGVVSHMWGDI